MCFKSDIYSVFQFIKSVPKWDKFDDTEANMDLWYSYLKKFDAKVVSSVCKKMVVETKYLPDISDVYKKCRSTGRSQFVQVNYDKWCQEKWRQGYVPCYEQGKYAGEWRRKSNCIKVDGKYTRKICFCMDKLGARKVTEILKEQLKVGKDMFQLKKGDLDKGAWNNLRAYPEVLDQLVNLARTA